MSDRFDRPPTDWSDDELRVGRHEAVSAEHWYRDQRDGLRADLYRGIAFAITDEQRERARLYEAMEDAACPITVVAVERPGD